MRIALYGGSFNPPHLGHAEAAYTVYEELKPDKLLIIPANIPPHKEMEEGCPSAEERLELCRLAFAEIPGAEVSDIEVRREGRSYTADTVEQLRAEYPEDELILVMGTDMLLCFEDWYRFEYLLRECCLAVLAREDNQELELLEPTGCGNPPPVFLLSGASVRSMRAVGRNLSHLQMSLLTPENTPVKGIAFFMGEEAEKDHTGVDLLYRPVRNVFNGRVSIEAQVSALRPGI